LRLIPVAEIDKPMSNSDGGKLLFLEKPRYFGQQQEAPESSFHEALSATSAESLILTSQSY
jgi:hypothetical protein